MPLPEPCDAGRRLQHDELIPEPCPEIGIERIFVDGFEQYLLLCAHHTRVLEELGMVLLHAPNEVHDEQHEDDEHQ